jgi:hypothetical protein
MSPTQRTQKKLRDLGYHVQNCERKMPCTPAGYRGRLVTQDLWQIVDTWALGIDRDLLVQSTSGTNHSEHVRKALANEHLPLLLMRHDVEVWSWAKRGARGKRKFWTLRRTMLGLDSKQRVNVYAERKGEPARGD